MGASKLVIASKTVLFDFMASWKTCYIFTNPTELHCLKFIKTTLALVSCMKTLAWGLSKWNTQEKFWGYLSQFLE